MAIVLVTFCLLRIMGPVTLVGVAVLILFVPMIQQCTALMLSIRLQRVALIDERVGIVTSLLQGVSCHQPWSIKTWYECSMLSSFQISLRSK